MNRQEYMDKLNAALGEFDEEVKKEIVDDYNEHFDAGLAAGKTEEQIVEELGSIDELVAELKGLKGENKEGKKTYGSGINISGEDVANALNDIAKGLAGFIGSMAANFTKGAEKMTNGMSDGVEDFADSFVSGFESVSDKVVNKTTQFAKDIADSYKATRGEAEETEDEASEPVDVDATNSEASSNGDVKKIVVDTDCGNIRVNASEDGVLRVNYENLGTPNQKLAYKMESFQKGNTFYVYVKRQPGTTNFFRALTCPEINIYLQLPANMDKVELNSASGIIVANGISSQTAKICDVSGSVEITNSGFEALDIKNVSGRAVIEGVNSDSISVKTVSGSIKVEADAKDLKANSTSGSVKVNGKKYESLSASTVSGSIAFDIDECDGFAADVASTSGSINLTCGESVIKGTRSGKYVLGTPNTKVKASSISGSIRVNA